MSATLALVRRSIAAPAVLAALASGLSAQGLHRDERLGFQIRPPRGWEALPLRVDEAWIVGKYRSPKEDHAVDPETGYTYRHTPEMQILAFLEAEKPDPDDEQDDEQRGSRTYRDYKAYMRDNYHQGFFIEEEEVDQHQGLPVTRLLIKAEGKRYVLEKKVVAWVYETEVGNVAVQVEVTADSYKKMRSTIDGVLRSFRVIERTQPLETPADTAPAVKIDLAELSPAERKQHRIDAQRQLWERMTRDLPRDWSADEIDGVFVINHTDDRFARKVVEQMNAVRAWLDETFPDVAPGEFACPPIVRICKDNDEESAFRRGSTSYGVSGNRLVTHKGTRSETWEWEYISAQTLNCWFRERDPVLWLAMPAWLRRGLNEVIGASRAKGSKLEFDRGWLEQFKRSYRPSDEDDGLAIRTLMSMSNEEFYSSSDALDMTTQAAALTRFFVESRSRKTRQVLSDYLGNLQLALQELEAEAPVEKEDGAKEPSNEEEEEALFKERQEWFKARERRLLDAAFERTFAGWNAAEWRNLQREFRRSL